MSDKPRIVKARKPKPKKVAVTPIATVVSAKSPAQVKKDQRIKRLRERGY